ncbi:MAG: YafY family transcriptional regulator [Acidobacteriaceae bacterium]|nr:YafY family transcriptional regulator [Acidobacteriaceae bacterium]
MRADRLLSILLLLQSRRVVSAGELARRLEVSERTILRDMDALSGSGIPVIAERGKGGGWSLLDDYQTKLTGLSSAEIQALFFTRPAQLLSDLGLKRESEAALIKLQASLPAAARENAELARRRILIDPRGWGDPGEYIPCLPVLLDAVWRGRQVRFTYEKAQCEPVERTAHPLGLVAKGSAWYLLAQAEHEPHAYRVSRIREAAVLDLPAAYPPNFDLAAHWERSAAAFRERLPRYYATFLASPSVMRWIRYRGWRLEEETPEGDRVRVKLRFDIEEEAVQFALSFAADIKVIQPDELREKVLAGARAIVAASEASSECG